MALPFSLQLWLQRGSTGQRVLTVALCLLAGGLAGLIGAGLSLWMGLGLIVGLLGGLAMLADPRIGLTVFIAIAYLLPFGVIPVPIGGVKLSFIDLTLTVLLFVWLARVLSGRVDHVVTTPLDGFILIFLGLAMTSFLLGIESVRADVFRFFLKTLNSILFYFSITNTLRNRGDLERIAKVVLFAGTAAALIGLILYALPPAMSERLLSSLRVFGYPAGGNLLRFIAGTDRLRAIGTGIDPNVLGGMLILALPFTLSQLVGPAPLLRRRYLLGAVAAMLGCLVLTYSRGSWIGLVGAVVALAALRYRRLWWGMILVALALLVLPVGDVVFDRFESGIEVQDQAAAMRLGEYKDAIRLIMRYPVFGVGFGDAPTIDLYIGASSIYLMMAEEMGLVGLSVFLAAMAMLVVYALRALSRIPDQRLSTIQAGALGSVLAALTAGIFDHYFFNLFFPHTVALFWLFVALTIISTRMGLEHEQAADSSPVANKA